jgi:F0F1-type ATP synthase epsilon subunit
MNGTGLRLIVRTPREVVLDASASSLRVPAETGQVGLRPKAEPLVLTVEPGLVLVRGPAGLQFLGTAGGLLRCDGITATLLTPLAVVGDSQQQVLERLDAALAQPNEELEARATLGRLQRSLLRELRGPRSGLRPKLEGRA